MIWGGGIWSGGRARPGGLLGIRSVRSSQSPPPLRALRVWFLLTLRAAAAPRNDRLRCLDVRPPLPTTEGRGFGSGWVQPVIAQSLTGSMPPSLSLSGRKLGRGG